MARLKTLIQFTPSPDVVAARESGKPGLAGHAIVYGVGRDAQHIRKRAEMILPPDQTTFTTEAEEGQVVEAFVSPIDRDGVYGQAKVIRFVAQPKRMPRPVEEIHIRSVSTSLNVLGTKRGCGCN